MRVQLPTENLTFPDKVYDYPTWRKGYDESEKGRVAASIAIDKAFCDAGDLMERMTQEHAYLLWDRAGRPKGRSDEFWFAAHAAFERDAVEQLAGFRRSQLTRASEDASESPWTL